MKPTFFRTFWTTLLAGALLFLPQFATAQITPGFSIQPVARGGTGAATAAGARTNLGLGSSDSPTFAALTATGAVTASQGGVFAIGSAAPTLQISNSSTDSPYIGFYRGGTIRSALQLYADNDFRLLASDLTARADLQVKVALVDSAAAAPSLQIHNSNTDSPYLGFYRAGTLRSALQLFTDNDFRLYSSDLSTYAAIKVSTVTASSTVTTGAPTGGAGAWKLGIANAVSPTSPNRTITIEIGGTTYYLAAKTTND